MTKAERELLLDISARVLRQLAPGDRPGGSWADYDAIGQLMVTVKKEAAIERCI